METFGPVAAILSTGEEAALVAQRTMWMLDWHPISARRICHVFFDLLLGTYDLYWM
jgi:hypothetical protein